MLDTNCFIDASRSAAGAAAYEAFTHLAAPRLYLSSVVEAELRAGLTNPSHITVLEQRVLRPYERRGRVITPSPAAWRALGRTLSTLVREDGLELGRARRSFVFDILIAYSCRESGAILVSGNIRDLERIAAVFAFDFVAPFPEVGSV